MVSEMIAVLLAYLREGFEMAGWLRGDFRVNYRWGWRLMNAKGEVEFVALPDGWKKPDVES